LRPTAREWLLKCEDEVREISINYDDNFKWQVLVLSQDADEFDRIMKRLMHKYNADHNLTGPRRLRFQRTYDAPALVTPRGPTVYFSGVERSQENEGWNLL
jgi:hypothetical protein